ncbi:MAG: hypothetical protein ACKO1L_00505 [Brachymonas sp.]
MTIALRYNSPHQPAQVIHKLTLAGFLLALVSRPVIPNRIDAMV